MNNMSPGHDVEIAPTGTPARSIPVIEVLVLAIALIGSGVLVGLLAGGWLIALAFVVGTVLLGGMLHVLRGFVRPLRPPMPVENSPPDWTLTQAVIEPLSDAVAITDRAGRLVCANARFNDRFGGFPPTRLGLGDSDEARLEQARRAAWRDGQGLVPDIAFGEERLGLVIERVGRGDEHLLWRFAAVPRHELVTDVAGHVSGKLGRALTREGMMLAVVAADGQILAANASFCLRAAGKVHAALVGSDFVSHFRSDSREQIFFAREIDQPNPVRFLHVPIADPDIDDVIDPSRTPSVFLVVDEHGTLGEARTGLPQIEALLRRLPLGLAMTDHEGRLLFANAAFQRAAGLVGKPTPLYPSDLVIGEDKGALADAVRRHAQGSPTTGNVAVRLRGAVDEPVQFGLAGVRGLGEASVLISVKDSTEEARLRREIAQASKMQAVGQLAGGVAHDFNNVLTAIIGYCDLMLMRHTPGDSDYDDIQQIKANSNRAASLTRQLLAFSRQQTLRPQVLQLPDVVAEVSTLLKRLIGEKITLEVSHDRNLGAVRADPVQLEQVLLNLAVNARDAMEANRVPGVLRLMTRRITAADVVALGYDIMPLGDYTALVVEDNGHGIPADKLPKIFEPFFTTKEKGKGTGLGLATVYGIVKQSGGFVFAESQPGVRTRFSIYLPVHIPDPDEVALTPAIKASDAGRSTWTKGGRVLLVEDEDTVRAVAERALVRQGYDVTTAADGEEGLEAIESTYAAGGAFDLVVSDVVMPSMDGPTMAREIRARRPELPFLFMSGYAEETLRREIDIPNMHFLPKPFSVLQIVAAVEHVLRAG